jgi:hypothetical protein
MSPSTKREAPIDPRNIEPRQRRSSRLNRKHSGSYSIKILPESKFWKDEMITSYRKD